MTEKSIYSSPESALQNRHAFEWDGEYIKVQSPAHLPEVCIGCAQTSGLNESQDHLNYVNPLVFFWILLSPLALIIAYFVCRRKAETTFSQCSACSNKTTKWARVANISWAVFVLAIIVRILIGPELLPVQAAFIFGSPILALFATAMKDTQLSIKKFIEPTFYIKGFSKEFKSKLTSQ
ncbi:hypothetical protein [Microbulbifer hydrolyticus]|uniref:DUF4870 domain-containing protein n=1 Tax=Microbulbifer hydrolyticus TaxID=48074 RepID=A0A6P1TBM3_9GAMM|nr:hypothetical protein [Microbulbifer hydrolyticus]MBB5212545.1 hypothetical protein [Microbulbifer hydrolyticus]QHQ40164.1 hypothetical protein GTQ55_15040 [Microbulbifer hydrolyticus]